MSDGAVSWRASLGGLAPPDLARHDAVLAIARLEEGRPLDRGEVAALGAGERARWRAIAREAERDRFGQSHVFLRRFVAWLIGARPADLAFGVRPGGKPFLARPSGADVRFNLSHAGAYCAVAGCVGRDVGVDIERERPLVDLGGVAALALSSRERAELASFAEGERPRAFFRAWALKEAYAKALGRGVVGELAVVEVSFSPDRPARLVADRTRPDAPGVWTLLEPGAPAGYVCALAVAGAAGRVARLVERVDGSVTIARGAGVPGALAAR